MEPNTTPISLPHQTADAFTAGLDAVEDQTAEHTLWGQESLSGNPSAIGQDETEADTRAPAEKSLERPRPTGSGQPTANAQQGEGASQSEPIPQSTETAQPETGAAEPSEKTWLLRHLDEARQVGESELVTLAQKGLDYDRIRRRYDESKPVMALLGRLNRSPETPPEARRAADLAEFAKTFPDAARDPAAIPPAVWADVRGGMRLTAAYAKHRIAQADADAAQAKQQAAQEIAARDAAARSTGSMRGAGEGLKGRNAFLEGWGE